MLRNDPNEVEKLSDDEGEAFFQKFVAWTEKLHNEKRLHAVDRLMRENTKTLRKRGSSFVVDGPYCEAKDAITGYFLIEAKDPTEAIEIAKGCPVFAVAGGSVELRELGPFPKPS
jgi:hypothetical protein